MWGISEMLIGFGFFFMGNFEGKRSLGRLRRRREGNIMWVLTLNPLTWKIW